MKIKAEGNIITVEVAVESDDMPDLFTFEPELRQDERTYFGTNQNMELSIGVETTDREPRFVRHIAIFGAGQWSRVYRGAPDDIEDVKEADE